MRVVDLSNGWAVAQDVHDQGEALGVEKPGWDATAIGAAFSEWEPLERLVHLQLAFARQPFFGRELRSFNEHPWWYRLSFATPVEAQGRMAALRFDGVDYFCKVWLNGFFLGEHEGYAAPFEFEVGDKLLADAPNVLIVKVWSPWDGPVPPDKAPRRVFAVQRTMIKGTYEHADTFIPRDVNPVGIWRPVSLLVHDGIVFDGRPWIVADLNANTHAAAVSVTCPLRASRPVRAAAVRCQVIAADTGQLVCEAGKSAPVSAGKTQVELRFSLDKPRLWWSWDRGQPALYRCVIQVWEGRQLMAQAEERFGVRSVDLRRSPTETTLLLNDAPLFLRGTSYFPDLYLSAMGEPRYRRDLAAIRHAGCNAVRVHVHVENETFYDLCDEIGLVVIHDADLNWAHPADEAWCDHAAQVFGDMICRLRNHPAIAVWICTNEPEGYRKGVVSRAGLCLEARAHALDPTRPTIRASGTPDDVASGDSHNWEGSLNSAQTHYTDIFGEKEKLCTEFGMDAPGWAANLRTLPEVYHRLRPVAEEAGVPQYYQYRLLKYFIEHYRISKYQPCSGYFQFMFIDLAPQSFYGVYDWWGMPKDGLRAFEESGQPLAIIMEHKDAPLALWVVNDLLTAFAHCRAEWTVVDAAGALVAQGQTAVDVLPDSALRVCDLTFAVDPEKDYRVTLRLCDDAGRTLAQNVYASAFQHPPHPRGHPARMSHETGMRLYWA